MDWRRVSGRVPPDSQRRRTLQDVADAVGLSTNTVSRALRGESGMRETTRERIRREADRLGYIPNVRARALAVGSLRTIGIVLTNITYPFYADLLSAVEWHAAEEGYRIVLLLTDESAEREQAAAESVIQSGLDGVIVVPVQARRNPWRRVDQTGIPIVVVNRELSDLEVETVSTNHRLGAYAATTHLAEQGSRSIVMLEEDLPISTINDRIQGFQDALSDAGIDVDKRSIVMVPSRRSTRAARPWEAGDAYRLTADLFSRGYRPDGFVLGSEYFALGVFQSLREQGLRCPEDTLVVGYGDHPFAEFLNPALSTVRLPAAEVARVATELLLRRLRGENVTSTEPILIESELVVRCSTLR